MARGRSIPAALCLPLAWGLTAGAARAQSPGPLDGVWRTEGYGLVARIHGDSLLLHQVTSVSCIANPPLLRTRPPVGAEAAFSDSVGGPPEILVLTGGSASRRVFHGEGSASSIVAERVAALPGRCGAPAPAGAPAVFEVFWQTWAEQYPFFQLRDVDWRGVRERFRGRVAAGMPDDSLMAVLRAMIEPLHDAHTFIADAQRRNVFRGGRPDPDPLDPGARRALNDSIAAHYLRGPLRSWCNGRIAYGWLPDSVGYLRISGFAGYASGGFQDQLAALRAALDTIFSGAGGMRGLVLDVRFNGGGADPLGLEIASRLATGPYVAYAKVARADTADPSKLTPPQPDTVRLRQPGFRGPVVELISRYSVSAAETFTQALMGRRPAIERVGENTQGVFSDVLVRRLPNGWLFGLPNELFLTAAGTSFDVTGIAPTIPVPIFPPADRAAFRDAALERALALLGPK